MSTKTSLLKRIAQTAVVALVGGLLGTALTPAANAASNPNVAVSAASCVMREGVGGFISVTIAGYGTGTAKVRARGTDYTLASGFTSYSSAAGFLATPLTTGVINDTTSSTLIIPLASDTVTAVQTLVYNVWLDVLGTDTTSPGATSSASRSVTCTNGGAPTSFSLSATSATAVAGDTTTFTVTPKGAGGLTTILKPGTESFTVKVTPTAGRATIMAGRLTGAGTGTFGGAGLSDMTTFKSGTVSINVRAKIATGDTALGFMTPIAGRLGGGANTGSSVGAGNSTNGRIMPTGNANWEGGAATSTINIDADMADALPTYRNTTGVLIGSAQGEFGGNGAVVAESATSTGAFSMQLRADSNTTTTAVVNGAGLIANSVTSTFTLTTTQQVYGSGYGFGSAAAIVAPGFGIIKSGTGWSATASTVGLVNPDNTGTYASPTTGSATADNTINLSTARTTIPLTIQLSQAGTFNYTVAAVTGYTLPTGVTAGSYTWTSPSSETQASITWTVSNLTDGQRFTVAWSASAATTRTVTFVVSAPKVGSSDGSVTLRDTQTSKKYNVGGTNTVVATVRDQYGTLLSGVPVTFSVSGRNIVAASNVNTIADGTATYTYTDASTSTTSLTDTVSVVATFGNSGTFTTAVTTTYTASTTALAAVTITVTSDAATTGVAANGAVGLTVTVTDANGLATGYPVTITTDSKAFATATGALTANAYTNTNGVATATIWAKTLGTSTVTVTSAGKSATLSFTVIAGAHRTIAVDAATVTFAPGESKRITATVKDSFGNVDADVAVTIAYTGTSGRVTSVNGVQASSCTTNADGQCVIELGAEVAGTGTLTVTMTGGDSAATVLNDGSARPTRVLTASTAVTVSGSSATVKAVDDAKAAADAATDAALEAIDAANAATDAANLAAEAADAATVAAEEARDAADAATAAVEALATEVATLMAALKAQITTLASTVAKIAKKVKA